jgi:hypothetical protein
MNLLSKYRVSLLAAFLAVLSLAPAAQAQGKEAIGRVNVPFAFECGLRHYPTGIYELRTLSNDVLLIKGSSSHLGVAMIRRDMDMLPVKTGKAVFGVSGNQYFLREIRSTDSTTYVIFKPAKAGQRKLASNSIHESDVQLALLNVPR